MLIVIKSKNNKIRSEYVAGFGDIRMTANWMKGLVNRIKYGELHINTDIGLTACVTFNEDGSVAQESFLNGEFRNEKLLLYKSLCGELFSLRDKNTMSPHEYKKLRQWFFALSFIYTNETLGEIGAVYNMKHAIVIYSARIISTLVETKDAETMGELIKIADLLGIQKEKLIEDILLINKKGRCYVREEICDNKNINR
jgi:hypothetical protein